MKRPLQERKILISTAEISKREGAIYPSPSPHFRHWLDTRRFAVGDRPCPFVSSLASYVRGRRIRLLSKIDFLFPSPSSPCSLATVSFYVVFLRPGRLVVSRPRAVSSKFNLSWLYYVTFMSRSFSLTNFDAF